MKSLESGQTDTDKQTTVITPLTHAPRVNYTFLYGLQSCWLHFVSDYYLLLLGSLTLSCLCHCSHNLIVHYLVVVKVVFVLCWALQVRY